MAAIDGPRTPRGLSDLGKEAVEDEEMTGQDALGGQYGMGQSNKESNGRWDGMYKKGIKEGKKMRGRRGRKRRGCIRRTVWDEKM